jgi:tetratricopeptide (TPR) repeat protein
VDGPDTTLPAKKRQDYADRYARRAAAFNTCKDTADAAATYGIAVRQDPQNFTVIASKAQFDADQSDWQGAIADNTAAIALKDQAPPGVNILSVYAARAQAYDQLKMYGQEIADLKQVVDHFNDELHDTLLPFDVYKEALAKAYYRSNDVDDAEAMLLAVDDGHMDWEDEAFLGQVRAQGKLWDNAIAALTKALARMPADPSLKPRHAAIELQLAQAYQARAHDGDARGAWDAYNAAITDDPSSTDAKAGLMALGPMLEKPTFAEPALDTLVMPAGVTNLDTDNPPPFCSQEVKNDYLDSVKTASNTVNTNMTTLGETIDALLKTRATYDASGLLTYSEKIEYLALFDAQWKKLDTENTQLRATGDSLLRFFARIRDNDTLVHVGTCKS